MHCSCHRRLILHRRERVRKRRGLRSVSQHHWVQLVQGQLDWLPEYVFIFLLPLWKRPLQPPYCVSPWYFWINSSCSDQQHHFDDFDDDSDKHEHDDGIDLLDLTKSVDNITDNEDDVVIYVAPDASSIGARSSSCIT